MTDHCPACRVARELLEHRDATAAEWSVRRGTLNFARIVAERACPAYVPATSVDAPDALVLQGIRRDGAVESTLSGPEPLATAGANDHPPLRAK